MTQFVTDRRKAFTLIELMLVIVIIGILLGSGVLLATRLYLSFQIENSRDTLAQWMEFQQEKAILTGKSQRINVLYDRGQYEIYDGESLDPFKIIEVHRKFKLKGLDTDSYQISREFHFQPDGFSDEGTIAFEYEGKTDYQVKISGGVVSVNPPEKM